MHPTTVVLLQKRARQGFGLGDIGVEAHSRIDAHREGQAGSARAAPGPPHSGTRSVRQSSSVR